MTTRKSYFDPVALAKLSNLLLRARFVVEGVITGLHRSPYRGSSVEFSEHREYSPGDEIRYVDWKVYGKSDRYFIKQFEEETNLKGYIFLDCSSSMDYASDGITKFEYGCYVAASLAYLMLRQGDPVGLVTFSDSVRRYIPPRSSLSHIHAIIEELENSKPSGKTSPAKVLGEISGHVKRRGLIILISDLFADPEETIRAIRQYRYKKNEVMVFQILDQSELEFPFSELTIFEDLEDDLRILSEPRAIREEYRRIFQAFIKEYERLCRAHHVDYTLFNTATPLDKALVRYLSKRG
ncbi:MAG: DUF58 domain-containing protein [Candidatus Tectomicrobia bacterium]|nr:DUF58 domain-containing protein [Candidatus Tectomicrobia bacterium]